MIVMEVSAAMHKGSVILLAALAYKTELWNRETDKEKICKTRVQK